MRRAVEQYIPNAIRVIEELEIVNGNGEVAKQFNGYIASFGASVRQAGLLATVLFYGNASLSTEKEREKVVKAIELMIGHDIINNNSVEKSTRAKVEDAAIALKLAIRTYKLV